MATSDFNYVSSHRISDIQSGGRNNTCYRKGRKRGRKNVKIQGKLFCDHCRALGHSMPFCHKLDFCDLCCTPGHNPLRCRIFSISSWMTMAQYHNKCEECLNPLENDMSKCAVCRKPRVHYTGSHKKQSSQTESFKVEKVSQTIPEDTKVANIVNRISLDDRIPNDSVNSNVLIGKDSIVSPTVLTYFNDLHEKTMQQIKMLSHDVQQNKFDLESRLSGLDSGLSSVSTLTLSNLIKTGHLSSQIENLSIQNAHSISINQCSRSVKNEKTLQDNIINWELLFNEKYALTKQQASEIDKLNYVISDLKEQELRNTTIIHENHVSQLHSISTKKAEAFNRIKELNLKLYEKEQLFIGIQRERDKLLVEINNQNSQISSQELFHKKFPLSKFNNSLRNDAFVDSAKSKPEQSQAHEVRIASLESKMSSLEKHVTQNTNRSQHQNNKNVILCLKQDFRVPNKFKANIGDNCYFSNPSISCDSGNKYGQTLVSSLSSCSENPGVLESYEINPPKQDENFEGEIQDQFTVNKNKNCGLALKLGDTVALLKDYQSFRSHMGIKFKSCNEYDHLNYYNCNGNFYREI